MKVYIDGKGIDASHVSEASTLGDAVENLREHGALGDSDVVLEAALDGASCSDTPAEDIGQVRLDGVSELCLETGSAREYGIRVLQDAHRVTEFLQDAAGQVAGSLRHESPQESNGHLYRLLDTVHTLLLLLRCVDDAWGLEGMSFSRDDCQVMAGFSGVLDAIEEAQQKENWERLADQLDVELVYELEKMADVIDRTRRLAEEGEGCHAR